MATAARGQCKSDPVVPRPLLRRRQPRSLCRQRARGCTRRPPLLPECRHPTDSGEPRSPSRPRPTWRTGRRPTPATCAASTRPATMRCTTRSPPPSRRHTHGCESLKTRPFVATESRLHTAVELFRQIVHGTDTDPQRRLAELRRRRDEIDAEIAVRRGRPTATARTCERARSLPTVHHHRPRAAVRLS